MTFIAILINPTLKTIDLVVLPKNSEGDAELSFLQECVGGTISGVGYILPTGKVGSYKDDFIYVNDNGLDDESTDFVKIPNYAQEFYRGNMLIVGSDGEGGTANIKMHLVDVVKFIQIIPKEYINVNLI